jgi:hypothetical protein
MLKRQKVKSRQAKSKDERVEERRLALETLQAKVKALRANRICFHCYQKPRDLKPYDAGRVIVEACEECIKAWDSGNKPLPDLRNTTFTSVAIGGLPSLGKRY